MTIPRNQPLTTDDIARVACGWRIVISPMIPQDSPSCYDSSMRNLAVLFVQFVATLAR